MGTNALYLISKIERMTMYAVIFDLSEPCLRFYGDIQRFMESNGFAWRQGGAYFGDDTVTAVTCVTTVQKLAEAHPQFAVCVRSAKMLRIEEESDLMPAIKAPSSPIKAPSSHTSVKMDR